MIDYSQIAAFIVPTGVGASIGGFAGDASPFAQSISEVCPIIVNPNVVNAACFSGINNRMLYTEGFAIDEFFKGNIALRPSMRNKIGVILDKGISQRILNVHINTINAVKTVYGIESIEYTVTDQPVGVEFTVTSDGISSGNVNNPETLIRAGRQLTEQGADALAVVCLFDDCEDDNYANGTGVDPVGGVEAIISHILTKELLVPVAHAPAFETIDISTEIVSPKAASEYITPTFLPCILLGLNNAPKPILINMADKADITLDNLKALIVPHNCLGSIPVLSAIENNIPILAVKENNSVLKIDVESLGINDKVTVLETYQDAKRFLEQSL